MSDTTPRDITHPGHNPFDDPMPRWGLLPAVGDDDPDGGEDGTQRNHHRGEQVKSRRHLIPSEYQHGQRATWDKLKAERGKRMGYKPNCALSVS